MGPNDAVRGAKRDTPKRAMSSKQTVERVACPVHRDSLMNERHEGNIVDDESGIRHNSIGEIGVTNRKFADLGEKLNLKEGNRRHAPRAVAIEPRKLRKPLRPENQPNQKMCVEKHGHRRCRRRGASWRSEPRHSHDHRSASSARGTRRSRLYCRVELPFFAAVTSSRRSTSRRPRRSTAITSPLSASSRRRNQCFLASDALTLFTRIIYKTRRPGARRVFRFRP